MMDSNLVKDSTLENEYLTVRQVCSYLKVSRVSIFNYTKKGILAPRKIGGRVLFLRSEIDNYLQGKEV